MEAWLVDQWIRSANPACAVHARLWSWGEFWPSGQRQQRHHYGHGYVGSDKSFYPGDAYHKVRGESCTERAHKGVPSFVHPGTAFTFGSLGKTRLPLRCYLCPLMSLSHMVVQQLADAKGIFPPVTLTFSPIQPKLPEQVE